MNTTLIPLDSSHLQQLSDRAITPTYDRSALKPRIVHVGAGGFNRSHLAVYLDDLLGRADTARWAECGIGLLPPDMKIHAALVKQDYLYSLLVRDAGQKTLRIVGSLVEHIYAPSAQELVIERMSSSDCSIVSLTVTEGGYFTDDASKTFLSTHPDVQFDLEHPSTPRTFLGYLAEVAERRMKRGLKPFTIMSCDNLQGNGDTTRASVLAFAEMRSPSLRQWIEQNVAFPNAMVDRITPTTTEEDRAFIRSCFGVSDESPVVSEPFRQWVIEDTFCDGRPQFELVGVQLTSDVKPFEMTKMRLLNGGHSTIAYLSAMLGITYVSEAVEDKMIRSLLEHFLQEVTQTLPKLPGMDLTDYKASIVHRFSNPTIRDQILRICSEGSAKIAKFIVPTVCDMQKMGKCPEILPLMVASWLYSMRGTDENGQPTQIVDSSAQLFAEFVRTGCRDVRLALGVKSVFGDLGREGNPFIAQVKKHLDDFHADGARKTISRVIAAENVGKRI